MAQPLSDYEAERIRRIEENKRRMAEIGILDTRKEMDTMLMSQTKRSVQKIKRQRIATPLEMRRSNRCAGKDAPNYREHNVYHAIDYTARTRLPRRTGGYCKRVMEAIVGWNPSKGEASSAAAEAALDAAESLIARLENPAFAKIMSQSQVSGGFWANAPRGVKEYVTFDTKTTIQMRVAPETTLPDGSDIDDSETWPVVWLPRKTGAGFSGGWRGFAIDMDLYPSDVCVFEIADAGGSASSTGGRGSARDLLVHIFRAFDFESQAVRDARKQDAAEGDEDEATMSGDSFMEGGDLEEQEDVAIGEGAQGKGAFIAKKKLVVLLSSAAQDAGLPELTTPDTELLDEPVAGDLKKAVGKEKKKKIGNKQKAAAGRRDAPPVAKIQKVQKTKAKTKQPEQPKQSTAGNTKKKGSKVVKTTVQKEEEERYYVEKIMDVRVESDGTPRFLIKWLGYPESDNSWEPAENLDAAPESYRRAPGVNF